MAKNKMQAELKEEISVYLDEVKKDLEQYLAWAKEEVNGTTDPERASEVVEDAILRLMTISFYLASFFDDAEPSQIVYDLANEVAEEQAKESATRENRFFFIDPANRTRH